MTIPGFRIAARFNGPPGSGNGGYVAGRLAVAAAPLLYSGMAMAAAGDAEPAHDAIAVRLHAPPPLERDLRLAAGPDEVQLLDGDTRIATARAAPFGLSVPPAPSLARAEAAAGRCAVLENHPYPACFVCGPERAPGDGLRILPGPLDHRGHRVVAPWRPDASLAGPDGSVAPPFVWAALDCPGGFTFEHPTGGAVLLGEMRAALGGAVAVGEPCVVLGWDVSHSGRKHVSATVLYGADGSCRACALATWLEVPGAAP